MLSGGCRDRDPLECCDPPPPPPPGLTIVSKPVPSAAVAGAPSARVVPVV
jgi:hypothetical protein